MNVAFRVDISTEIGTGHYTRMSSLAEVFTGDGHFCKFFKSKDEPIDYSKYNIIILDSYELNNEYIAKLNDPNRLVVCCDDNANYTYNCDVVLNPNLYSYEIKIKTAVKTPNMLLGGKYALLRKEFRESYPIKIRKNANHIFVCFGGSDLRNMTPKVIKTLRNIKGVKLSVVLGKYTKNNEEVAALESENVSVYKTPKRISEIMNSCDIAVTASGSMINELAVLGIPTITITQAENQFLLTEFLVRKSLIKSAGNWINTDFEFLRKIVVSLLSNYDNRRTISRRIQKMVDKNGAYNSAYEILKMIY